MTSRLLCSLLLSKEGDMMGSLTDTLRNFISFIPTIRPTNIVEILIISVLIYYILLWIRDTRAWTLLKGVLVILAFVVVAYIFEMNTILWLFGNLINVTIICIFILFQPELRRALEQLGSKNILASLVFFGNGSNKQDLKKIEKTITEIVKACGEMSRAKTGALIVIEQSVRLSEYERTGIFLDSLVSSQLLINIFEHNTPLHDGAVIIRNNRIVSATCYLPLSDSVEIGKELGTRHRAAVGISEVSDSITVIVSEETGDISIAVNGKIKHALAPQEFRDELSVLREENTSSKKFKLWKGLNRNERKNRE